MAAVLGTDQVLRVKRLNLADDVPFAVVTVWCPAELGHHLSRRDVERHPFYELLGVPLRGATQTIGADSVDGADASLLGVPVASPVLRCERITTDTTDVPCCSASTSFLPAAPSSWSNFPRQNPPCSPAASDLSSERRPR